MKYLIIFLGLFILYPLNADTIRDEYGRKIGSYNNGVFRDEYGRKTGSFNNGIFRDEYGRKTGSFR